MMMSLLAYSAPGVLNPSNLAGANTVQGIDAKQILDKYQSQRPFVDGSNILLFVLFVLYT